MKVALVHDLLTQLGGAERVLDELLEIFPEAPVYTALYDETATEGRYAHIDIRPSFLQRLPRFWSYKWYLPLMPKAVENFDLSGYDLVFSDASAFAKGVFVPKNIPHICYCHTPTRYLWSESEDYIASIPYPRVIKWAARRYLTRMKAWDYQAAQRVSCFLANSKEVQRRIDKYYHRTAEIIYPPVDTNFFVPAPRPSRDYFLTAGRMEPYKCTGIVLQAFQNSGQKLKVAGAGSRLAEFKRLYNSSNIEFLGRVSDLKLRELYQNATALIFPALEDAGMMMVEAMACGAPVIAYRAGGALEFISDGKTGKFFTAQTSAALSGALQGFRSEYYAVAALRAEAEKYSRQRFQAAISKVVERASSQKS
ncbi:MAG: glycosyltransferase [Patescibacteria group bacterium]|nr:glycosyltransferase [Patescibacteria group bacterium]